MKLKRHASFVLLLLVSCTEPQSHRARGPRVESSRAGLGTVPANESATWTRFDPRPGSPDPRYLQAAAFDETRKVLVMFGGIAGPDPTGRFTMSGDLWEWDPATDKWTNRTPTGAKPSARAGASMVYDATRRKFVIFGGHDADANTLQDTWEWDASTGGFTARTQSEPLPDARSEHSMVFEKSTGKVLLFGGGNNPANLADYDGTANDGSYPGAGVQPAYSDTWEWDPATGAWGKLAPSTGPSDRCASAMVWDSSRNRAVLFGGLRGSPDSNPQQDTWEWDPAKKTWTDRTVPGNKPSPRYGHAMAYDSGRGAVVLAGGFDIGTGDGLADLWDWDPTTAAWKLRLSGSEANLPTGRLYASLVSDSARTRLELVAGVNLSHPSLESLASAEIWELDPAAPTFTNRTPPPANPWPERRTGHAMAFCPATGKMTMFGGQTQTGTLLDDLWEWDGSAWALVASDLRPAPRQQAAMAYDSSRKSLILFGGQGTPPLPYADEYGYLNDTWEWQSGTRKWSQLLPTASPDPVVMHAMVSDASRAKALLFGGQNNAHASTYPIPGVPRSPDSLSNAVWEWDGGKTTWTNRTPVTLPYAPVGRALPLISFDDGRQRMFLFDSALDAYGTSDSAFWEWDPVSAGWALRDSGDTLNSSNAPFPGLVAYDSFRRRQVMTSWDGDAAELRASELDPRGPTWYGRILSTSTGPSARVGAAVAFDSQRGVMVLFGGSLGALCPTGTVCAGAFASSETWEYKVTKLGNGEGCTVATASICASGFCVEGVCCEKASCSGACQSCSVAGHEGTCVRAVAGTEVPGSCSNGQACDGTGKCKSKNGATCSSASGCASGFCADGVCCESACDDLCVSCNQVGRTGQCSPYVLGSDPENECDLGHDPCRLTCNGAGACDQPQAGTVCGPCQICSDQAVCAPADPFACGPGDGGFPDTGSFGGAGGSGGTGTGGINTGGRSGAGGTGGSFDAGGDAVSSDVAIPDAREASAGDADRLDAGGARQPDSSRPDVAGDLVAPDASVSDVQGDWIAPDAGSPDGSGETRPFDAGTPARLGHSGCNCDLGQRAPGQSSLPFALFGIVFLWRRLRLRLGCVGVLLLIATCSEDRAGNGTRLESSRLALGTVPATESATWTRVDSSAAATPESRYLHAAAFDETRKVLVMFGGMVGAAGSYKPTPTQDLWEWDPAAGAWTNRTPAGSKPSARSGAAMIFDSTRNKFVIFGGRAATGYNYEDIWEWDPTTGAFTDRTDSGTRPAGRSQHRMVFEKSTGKVLLFGGGSSATDGSSSIFPLVVGYDGSGVDRSFDDTWEWDPVTGAWFQLRSKFSPSARFDSALVWDSQRTRAVLFGGMEQDVEGGAETPRQDTWEWDPAAAQWTERKTDATTPSARWGHAMAYDRDRGKIVLLGGMSVPAGGELGLTVSAILADLWEWDPTTAAWTQRLAGSEPNLPPARMYASLLADPGRSRLDLLAGVTYSHPYEAVFSLTAFADVWELDPATAAFTDRQSDKTPSRRTGFAMAFCPANGKTYMFGGINDALQMLDDLWEWDGQSWLQVPADVRPPGRRDTAMAYDPFRKALVLFGGANKMVGGLRNESALGDTWEWQSGTRKWTELHPASSPEPLDMHAMVTDSARAKVLLFGGESGTYSSDPGAPTDSPQSNKVWEWDGDKTTWTDRTPVPVAVAPARRLRPLLSFDEGRGKMFLFEGLSTWKGTTSNSVFWEWDPATAGWAFRDSGDFVDFGPAADVYVLSFPVVAYDSLRRRLVIPTNAPATSGSGSKTWELDSNGPTWYLRTLSPNPGSLDSVAMVFDSQRGVMVLVGAGPLYSGANETWEYKVTKLGNGQGCTAATASTCASGFCVQGVCCGVAACSGACQSCAVAGHEGTCMAAAAGTEVPGSCPDGQACDGGGSCKSKNGSTCASASACASGFCVDGVCCDSACNGKCAACTQASRAGKCSFYAAGSDPQNECGLGVGACRSTCNGAGACDYPDLGTPCGPCQQCDGAGLCWDYSSDGCNTGSGGEGGSGAGGSGAGGASGSGGISSGGANGTAGVTGSGGAGGFGGSKSGDGHAGGARGGGAASNGGTSGSGNTSGAIGRSDGGGDPIQSDAGAPDGSRDSVISDVGGPDGATASTPPDAGHTLHLGHSGCSCDLREGATPSLPFALLGLAFLWRRLRPRPGPRDT